MPKYVIERDIPGAGSMTEDELRAAAENSNTVIRELGPDVQWIESYVTDDKLYCVFMGSDPDIILEHARCADVPADRISQVRTVIDPSTAD